MNRRIIFFSVFIFVIEMWSTSCRGSREAASSKVPPAAKVEQEQDVSLLHVDHPDQFQLERVIEYFTTPSLSVTGTVSPDVSRTVPVISLASGRVVEIRARLGDTVQKGQVLLRVQSADIASAFSDYRKAVADATLASKQIERARDLYDKGAISLSDLQVAQDTEQKAQVDVETTLEHLQLLGVDQDHPGGVVDIKAPTSGVITEQQVTSAAGVQGLAGSNPFTISDLSTVWVLCDVYENDLANVHIGETAVIRLNAYPERIYAGKISNIGPILDANLRTAKVRIQVANPGMLMRVGMFATATFHGQKKERVAALSDTAILHLHDRDWVYVPAGDKKFKRIEVRVGESLPSKLQVVRTGIEPGQEVVKYALTFQSVAEQ